MKDFDVRFIGVGTHVRVVDYIYTDLEEEGHFINKDFIVERVDEEELLLYNETENIHYYATYDEIVPIQIDFEMVDKLDKNKIIFYDDNLLVYKIDDITSLNYNFITKFCYFIVDKITFGYENIHYLHEIEMLSYLNNVNFKY